MDNKYLEFEKLGGREMLKKISKIFYDKVYSHPWISQYFYEVDQSMIENQQVDFMTEVLGGPLCYSGKFPIKAHKHMFINQELFALRESLLQEAFYEAHACEELQSKWLKIDNSFKSRIVKQSLEQCEKRFKTDEIFNFPNPAKKAA